MVPIRTRVATAVRVVPCQRTCESGSLYCRNGKILVMDCASGRPTLAGRSRVSPSYTSSLREPMRTVHGSRGRTRVSVGEERGTWWQGVPDSYSGPWLCG